MPELNGPVEMLHLFSCNSRFSSIHDKYVPVKKTFVIAHNDTWSNIHMKLNSNSCEIVHFPKFVKKFTYSDLNIYILYTLYFAKNITFCRTFLTFHKTNHDNLTLNYLSSHSCLYPCGGLGVRPEVPRGGTPYGARRLPTGQGECARHHLY